MKYEMGRSMRLQTEFREIGCAVFEATKQTIVICRPNERRSSISF